MHELPSQPRLRSIADLDRRITDAEKTRDQRRELLRGVAIRSDTAPARMMLELAEDGLAQLYRSRKVLLEGNKPNGAT
jgi:hypothetical protein